jgi:hypothetical protein
VALLAARADVVRALADELAAAGARGVEVLVKSDEELSLARIESFLVREDDLLRHGSFIRLVTDGEQVLSGVLAGGEDAQMIWSGNISLALLQHEGLAAEIALLSVAERIDDGAGPKRLAKALAQAPLASKTPGASRRG